MELAKWASFKRNWLYAQQNNNNNSIKIPNYLKMKTKLATSRFISLKRCSDNVGKILSNAAKIHNFAFWFNPISAVQFSVSFAILHKRKSSLRGRLFGENSMIASFWLGLYMNMDGHLNVLNYLSPSKMCMLYCRSIIPYTVR